MTTPIRDIDAFAVRASDKTVWVFLRVRDADGIAGWGEATLSGKESALAAACTRISARICGGPAVPRRDPLADAGVARTDIPGAAIVSAIDQALWDLSGQREGRPMRGLLGATVHSAIPLYANVNRRTVDRRPEGFAASARKAIADGFDTIKIAPFDSVRPGGTEGIEEGIARAAAVREQIGPERRLFIDCHWRFDAKSAAVSLDALLSLAIGWFECPLPETPDNFADLRRLRARANEGGAVLAGCEMETGLAGFRPFIDAGVYDVLMPDIKYAGGLAEFRRIAEYAAARGVEIAPHNPSGPVSHVASLQFSAGLAGMSILEHQYDESPKFAEIVVGDLPTTRNGRSALPDGDGLGIALDPEKLVPLGEIAGVAT
jgi:galactonate dehydratase